MNSVRKSFAFIIRNNTDQNPELLTLSFRDIPYPYLRLPGGNVEISETPAEGLMREISEETGLAELSFVRCIGIARYYKVYTRKNVVRWDYLLNCTGDIPDQWDHEVTGSDPDSGEVFCYRWLSPDRFESIDPECRTFLTPECIPELYPA